MNALLQRFQTKLALWSDYHEDTQNQIPFDNPAGHTDYLYRRCANGAARLLDIFEGGERRGFIVYEIHCEKDRELYVLATHFENHEVDWTCYLDILTDELARAHKCVSKSCSTNRPGLLKKLTSTGFRIAEITLRKEVKY